MSMYRELRKKEGIVVHTPEFGYAGEVPVLQFVAAVRNDMQTGYVSGKEAACVRYCLRGERAQNAWKEGVLRNILTRGAHISHDTAVMYSGVVKNMHGRETEISSCYPEALTVRKDGETLVF